MDAKVLPAHFDSRANASETLAFTALLMRSAVAQAGPALHNEAEGGGEIVELNLVLC